MTETTAAVKSAAAKTIAEKPDGTWEMDAASFDPEPAGLLKVGGNEYPIFHFMDIPTKESIRVLKLSEDIDKADTYEARMERSVDQILLLNAGPQAGREKYKQIPREDLMGLAPRLLIALTFMAMSIAAVPQKAAADAVAELPASAPASADSTDGRTTS